MEFLPGAVAPAQFEAAYWFIFRKFNVLTITNEGQLSIPLVEDGAAPPVPLLQHQFIGMLDGVPCFSAETEPSTSPPTGMEFLNLRRLFRKMDDKFFWIAGRAVQIVDFYRTHKYCGRCAVENETKAEEHVQICPQCNLQSYPRLSPAVIMSVTKDDTILLAHGARHPDGFYSVLAGFVEPGETLEETVIREVKEEVNLDVTNVRYFGSQPWPFPNSLMIAFTSEYASGEIVEQEGEIGHAAWFKVDEMPYYPPSPSISNALIMDFVEKQKVAQ